jgi:hypothetical protein
MLKVEIDGSSHTGTYRVKCACETYWNGQGEATGDLSWSPALPIAEAVVHMRLQHGGTRADLDLSDRFKAWLQVYWEQASRRVARQQAVVGARQALYTRGQPPR